MNFIYSFQSEWLKKRRSLASWLVIVGAVFTPSIILLGSIKNRASLPVRFVSDDFWLKLWNQTWESMAAFLLPIGIILATSLITQIEYKNNAWKQLHATPQNYATIFFAKMLVILIMLIQVFILFNLAMYLSAIIPTLLFSNIPYPNAPIPSQLFMQQNVTFFIECLPVLALQYLISLQFKNMLVPIGIGFIIWFTGLGLYSWHYNYIFPYSHAMIDFMIMSGNTKQVLNFNLPLLSIGYFTVITIAGYILYVIKNEKG